MKAVQPRQRRRCLRRSPPSRWRPGHPGLPGPHRPLVVFTAAEWAAVFACVRDGAFDSCPRAFGAPRRHAYQRCSVRWWRWVMEDAEREAERAGGGDIKGRRCVTELVVCVGGGVVQANSGRPRGDPLQTRTRTLPESCNQTPPPENSLLTQGSAGRPPGEDRNDTAATGISAGIGGSAGRTGPARTATRKLTLLGLGPLGETYTGEGAAPNIRLLIERGCDPVAADGGLIVGADVPARRGTRGHATARKAP